LAHAPRVFSLYYYTCVSTPFRTCIFYSRPRNHNSMTTQQYLRVETTKTNKREFYFFYFSFSFYDLYCAYRFFSCIFFFELPLFRFLFFHFTSSIQTHARNRQNSTCIIIIIIIRVTVQHEWRLSEGWWWDETVWWQRRWVGTGNNASFNRRLISKGWLKAPSRPRCRRRCIRSRNCIGGPTTDVGMTRPMHRRWRAMVNSRWRWQLNLNTPLKTTRWRRRWYSGLIWPKTDCVQNKYRYIYLIFILFILIYKGWFVKYTSNHPFLNFLLFFNISVVQNLIFGFLNILKYHFFKLLRMYVLFLKECPFEILTSVYILTYINTLKNIAKKKNNNNNNIWVLNIWYNIYSKFSVLIFKCENIIYL